MKDTEERGEIKTEDVVMMMIRGKTKENRTRISDKTTKMIGVLNNREKSTEKEEMTNEDPKQVRSMLEKTN